MPAPLRYLLVIIFALFILGGCTAASVLVVLSPTQRTFWQVCQPEEVTFYDGEYCISVVEQRSFYQELTGGSSFEIAIAPYAGDPVDAHRKSYAFSNGNADVYAHIRASSVNWEEEGITFVEATGHSLFFPVGFFGR